MGPPGGEKRLNYLVDLSLGLVMLKVCVSEQKL